MIRLDEIEALGQALTEEIEEQQLDDLIGKPAEPAAEPAIEPGTPLAEVAETKDEGELPTTLPEPVEIDADLWDAYMLAYERSKEWAQTLKERRAEIELAMGEHEFATVAGKKRVRWFYRYPVKFQQARLKADHPEIIEAYSEQTAERRMELMDE